MSGPQTIREMLIESADKYKNNCAFSFLEKDGSKKEVSYEKLLRDVENGALSLLYGYKLKGEKAALICYNCYQWCVFYLACLYSGIVAVPVDRELAAEDIEDILSFAEVKAVFCDERSRLKLSDKSERSFIAVEGDGNDGFDGFLSRGENFRREGFEAEEIIDPDALAVLLFTSGTTGNPKGVMLSNSNLCSDLYLVRNNVRATENDRTLSVLPLHHTYETIAFLMMLYCGGSIAFCGGIRYLASSFTIFSPTVFVTVPLILEKLHKRLTDEIEQRGMHRRFRFVSLVSGAVSDEKRKKLFSSVHGFFGGRLEKIIVGAAALQGGVAEDFELFGFQVIIGYGLTECSPIVICNSVDDRTSDSIGRPLASTEIIIRNPDEKGVGELLVKGPMVMKGYYKNKKATSDVFVDGWFCTGDLGYCDKNGRYHITGRCKNVIVTKNGKNIYPEELEYRLCKNPFVKECIVYGEKGDVVSCDIYPDEEAIGHRIKNHSPGDEQIKAVINESVRALNRLLPSYKRIRKVNIVKDGFAKTTTHKIKRKY